jgi:hypothetical protein
MPMHTCISDCGSPLVGSLRPIASKVAAKTCGLIDTLCAKRVSREHLTLDEVVRLIAAGLALGSLAWQARRSA